MAKLIYSAIASLDGYVEDENGRFEWAEPDAEVHAFVNELERSIGTYLYGRRMHETMVFWEAVDSAGDGPAVSRELCQPAIEVQLEVMHQLGGRAVVVRHLVVANLEAPRTCPHDEISRAGDVPSIRSLGAEVVLDAEKVVRLEPGRCE